MEMYVKEGLNSRVVDLICKQILVRYVLLLGEELDC